MSGVCFEDAVRALAGSAPAPHGLRLRLEEVALEVRTNSAVVAEGLRAYFAEFADSRPGEPADMRFVILDGPPAEPPVPLAVRPHLPGKRPDKEREADLPGREGLPGGRIARKQATGMLFAFGGGWNVAVGPCATNRNQIVNFLCERYMERRVAGGWALGHAAGVGRRGRALALCGVAGMGKSTLSLHLLARGWDFVSNDRILVAPPAEGVGEAILHGIPKQPRVNPGTALGNPELAGPLAAALPEAMRRSYAALPTPELRAVEDKFDVRVDACFGPGRFRLAERLAGVVVLNWTHDAGGAAGPFRARRVDLAGRPDLLDALRKPPGVFYLPWVIAGRARLTPEAFLAAFAGVPAWEFSGGADFSLGAAACRDLLG